MKRALLTFVAVLTLALSMAGSVSATDHSLAPGTPGQANCEGQTRAFLAQASKEQLGEPGLGNLARFNELSVKEVQAIVREFCAQTGP